MAKVRLKAMRGMGQGSAFDNPSLDPTALIMLLLQAPGEGYCHYTHSTDEELKLRELRSLTQGLGHQGAKP